MSAVIIKAGERGGLPGGLARLDLRDIAGQAELMLASAREQAEQIIRESRRRAESERDDIREAAWKEGYEEGKAEGRSEGRASALQEAREQFSEGHASLLSGLTEMVDEIGRRREMFYSSARRDVVVLAIAIAARICQRFATMDDVMVEAAEQACREALNELREAGHVVVRAHPEDAAMIEHLAEPLSKTLKSSGDVRILEDMAVGRGGVIVESSDTVIDAEVQTRIERIADALVADWRQRLQKATLES